MCVCGGGGVGGGGGGGGGAHASMGMDAGIHILTLDMAQTKELWMLEYTF